MTRGLRWHWLLPALASLFGCAGGSETGNPVETKPVLATRIGLGVRSSDPELIAVSDGAQGTLLSEAWVALGEPSFLRPADCARFGNLDLPGLTHAIVDLARPNVRLTVDVSKGSYCGLALALENVSTQLPADAPAELESNSIVLKGMRADGTPFSLAYPEHDEVELSAGSASIDVTANSPRLLLSFDVAVWMQDVGLDTATVDADGAITIDATHNVALLYVFEQNVRCSAELYSDADRDSRVSAADTRLASCPPEP
jgi:hypothetical protein